MFRELIVWGKAVELAKVVYRQTQRMPAAERFGLTMQMRRAAVSVASNIAEGNARCTPADYLRFLGIARGSLAELETQILIAAGLGMMEEAPISPLLNETRRILQALINSLQRKEFATAPGPSKKLAKAPGQAKEFAETPGPAKKLASGKKLGRATS
ncbi:MAG TPA: four helix bundle protein [Phycisphaerae bacterium]|nr:four helix bundle protein [Phycisphaerae bacterium]HPC21593.1 four helix bundle protein [Phycisphaerae bacterium]